MICLSGANEIHLVSMKKMRGIALITVMLIVALAVILATQMNAKLMLQMQRATNIASNEQAYWYAMGAEAFAKRVLIDVVKKDPNNINLSQIWAQGKTSFPVENGSISGEIFDQQACFNLNALRTRMSAAKRHSSKEPLRRRTGKTTMTKLSPKTAFVRLLAGLNLENIDQFSADNMADALSDWLDKDDVISGAGGAEDSDYAAKTFPYLPANNYLASVNELRTIEHFSVATIDALRDYVCVLPDTNLFKLNINTVPTDHALLISAMLDIPLEDAEQALSSRTKKGFKNVDDFFNQPSLAKIKITKEQKQWFAVKSEYFTLKTKASFNHSFFYLNSIIKITNNSNVSVINRTIGQ